MFAFRAFVVVFVFCGYLIGAALVAAAEERGTVDEASGQLGEIETRLSAGSVIPEEELEGLQRDVASIRSVALACIKLAEQDSGKLRGELDILYPELVDAVSATVESSTAKSNIESPGLDPQRKDLQARKARIDEQATLCRLLILRANNAQARLESALREFHAQKLLARGPTLYVVLSDNLSGRESWGQLLSQLLRAVFAWDEEQIPHVIGSLSFVILTILVGLFVRSHIRSAMAALDRKSSSQVDPQAVSNASAKAMLSACAHYVPVLMALAGASAYLSFVPHEDMGESFVLTLSFSLLIFVSAIAVLRMFLNPCPPACHFLEIREGLAVSLYRRLLSLLLVILIWWLSQWFEQRELLSETMLMLVEAIITFLWVVNLMTIVWLLRRQDKWREQWLVPLLLSLALCMGLLASWAGYRNLSTQIVVGISNTFLLFGLTLIVTRLFSDLCDGLDHGLYPWQRSIRRSLRLQEDEFIPGLGWLKLLVNFILWVGFVFLVLQVWGARETTADIVQVYEEGFGIAGLTIVPINVLWALVIFSLLLALTRWFKARLDSQWLVQARMERSAREALVTSFGYVGVAFAIVVALSIAGITFTNIAIIAGALSVGIGFGLQNVVNNFVSGIIMLVERPVRNGDWIVVGETEGYVQRISIRTTTIRTFDSADVIVPNSDLISGQVTNWTLRNAWGRIKVPVGVAYGSDTKLVHDTLLQIAEETPEVIKGSPLLSDPYVLFLAFGDSSLNFELRAVIKDVDQRMRVISSINFAIDTAFRELEIEIPFPQRDVNFRNPLPKGSESD